MSHTTWRPCIGALHIALFERFLLLKPAGKRPEPTAPSRDGIATLTGEHHRQPHTLRQGSCRGLGPTAPSSMRLGICGEPAQTGARHKV